MKLAQEQCSAAELQQDCSGVAVELQRIGSKYAAEVQQSYSGVVVESFETKRATDFIFTFAGR